MHDPLEAPILYPNAIFTCQFFKIKTAKFSGKRTENPGKIGKKNKRS